jgi:hypothetical protein
LLVSQEHSPALVWVSGLGWPCHVLSDLVGTVEHPTHAELVNKAAEIPAPEHLLKGHLDLATDRKGLEQTFSLFVSVSWACQRVATNSAS